jgi:hypothetical protein
VIMMQKQVWIRFASYFLIHGFLSRQPLHRERRRDRENFSTVNFSRKHHLTSLTSALNEETNENVLCVSSLHDILEKNTNTSKEISIGKN